MLKRGIWGILLVVAVALFLLSAFAAPLSPGATTKQEETNAIAGEENVLVIKGTVDSAEQQSGESAAQPASGQAADLQQLHLGDRFIPPRGIDGIDAINDKVVALTFDDGPHGENTPLLLDTLKENGVAATFFVLGQNAERYPDIIKRIYEEGHELGNHSYDHTDLKTISYDQVMTEQYGKTNDAVENAIGLRTSIDRPPYGSMSEELAQQIGREQIMWSVDPEDWKAEYKNTDSLMDNIMNGTNLGFAVKDGAIILSHDIHKTTVAAYDSIIKELKNRGYKFVTVTQMIEIAQLRGKEVGYIFNGAPES